MLGLLLFLRSIIMRRMSVLLRIVTQKNGRSVRRRHNRNKNMRLSKMMKKDGTPSKGSNVQCRAYGAFKHTIEK
jgi:hypothetical protein